MVRLGDWVHVDDGDRLYDTPAVQLLGSTNVIVIIIIIIVLALTTVLRDNDDRCGGGGRSISTTGYD
jgi:hypothetical protein